MATGSAYLRRQRHRLGVAPVTEKQHEPVATVVIVTKDRPEELERAVGSAVAQVGPVEVIVVDDGSSDGAPEAIAAVFPEVRVVRSDKSRGYIVRRNEAAELARAPVIISIDDDAEFARPDTVEGLLPLLNDHRVGAVALPHVDLLQGEQTIQQAPKGAEVYVTHCFRGTAYAVRRDLFRQLGGFRESLFHQAEEQDLCLRMLAAGGLVAVARTPPILHHASSKRDQLRAWVYGPRNDILFAWHNVPMPYLLGRLARVSLYELWLGLRVRRPLVFARSLLAGYAHALRGRRCRRPVPRRVYRLYRELEARGQMRLEEAAAR
jgi:GT2 family glycosyltransferase